LWEDRPLGQGLPAGEARRSSTRRVSAEGDEPALFFVHGSIEPHSSPAPAAAALLHLDEPRAHGFHGNGSGGDKIDGWYLDTGATHHMTGRQEFFSELDSDV